MLRVGIIGCGKITEGAPCAGIFGESALRNRGFYDFVPERAQAFAEKYGGRAFESVEALIESVDAVSVCSANRAHAQNTICALEAGRHVLCEKPMATSLAECEAMVAAAKKANRLLMIGHNQRFNRAHQEARRLIQDGTIGRVLSFHTAFGHSGPENWTGTPNPWFFDKKRAAMGRARRSRHSQDRSDPFPARRADRPRERADDHAGQAFSGRIADYGGGQRALYL